MLRWNGSSWDLLEDRVALAAFDMANGKKRIFTQQPVPPYDLGDLWVQGEDGDILHCRQPKGPGQTFSPSDWVRSARYTDDTVANTKAQTFDGTGVPTPPYRVGDLWRQSSTGRLLIATVGRSYGQAGVAEDW